MEYLRKNSKNHQSEPHTFIHMDPLFRNPGSAPKLHFLSMLSCDFGQNTSSNFGEDCVCWQRSTHYAHSRITNAHIEHSVLRWAKLQYSIHYLFWESTCGLTHLSRMDFPTLIRRARPFSILRVLSGILFSNFNRTYCKPTVTILIRRRLVWICTVCICPIKRILGLYGLII